MKNRIGLIMMMVGLFLVSTLMLPMHVKGAPDEVTLVKDIHPSGDSYPYYLTAVGSTLYFDATDGTNGYELWRSDGTEAGTTMVKNIHPGGSSSPDYLTAVGSTLYFRANDGTNGNELWSCSLPEVPIVPEAPILTPVGIVALISALSAIAAVAIVRKRR